MLIKYVRIPADVLVEHSGFCIKVTACWVKRSTVCVDHSNGLPTPTVHSWHTATTLSEDVGSRPEVSIIIYRGSSSCWDVEK